MKITSVIFILWSILFVSNVSCIPGITVEPPDIQKITISANNDTLFVGDEITAIITSVGWRSDYIVEGFLLVGNEQIPFINNNDGTYTAIYIIQSDSEEVLLVSIPSVVLIDQYGNRSEPKSISETSFIIIKFVTSIIRWDDGDSTRIANVDDKRYKIYIGEQSEIYSRIDDTRLFAAGDSLQYHIPDLLIGNTYFFKIEEIYPGMEEGLLSDEVTFLILKDEAVPILE
jgi:hypothetical protein